MQRSGRPDSSQKPDWDSRLSGVVILTAVGIAVVLGGTEIGSASGSLERTTNRAGQKRDGDPMVRNAE